MDLDPRVSPASTVTYFCNHCDSRFDPMPAKVVYMCKPTQGSLCPSPIKIQYWPFLRDFSQGVNNPNWPLDDLWPRECWCHMCDSTQWSLCPTPILIHQSMWKQWLFPKTLTNTVMTPMWPLTHFGWGHMCDRPKLIVPKSHENMLKYVDTATIFPKLWLQSQWSRWPLSDLWPFVVTCATQPQEFCTYIHGPSNCPRSNFTRNLALTWI